MPHYLLLISLLTLTACQTQSLVELDYQPGLSYHSFHTWQWTEPAIQFIPNSAQHKSDLDAQRLRTAIQAQLTQQGLKQSEKGQLLVQAWLMTENKLQRTQVQHNDYWGDLWTPSIRTETYDTTYSSQTLQIDLIDASNQKLIWRGSNSWVLPQQRTSPTVRNARLHQQVQNILQNFPPQ
ncbi:DUF4136 domain-containing protein [Denitrificimonas sp. JX-1]|uniref:DUF4136 domain-containing protein n=1 Tax=Denitrificimonas halotolerans TaxID=3098930 RepID=A0ABU5GR92_9GAMM|nr:DUF4136 domain-containing protein [Denitrificimonas sp. JX-1]MDY7219506.1 DUF4136 domain-containing protein [Denitrificimonas sp. JX-1]